MHLCPKIFIAVKHATFLSISKYSTKITVNFLIDTLQYVCVPYRSHWMFFPLSSSSEGCDVMCDCACFNQTHSSILNSESGLHVNFSFIHGLYGECYIVSISACSRSVSSSDDEICIWWRAYVLIIQSQYYYYLQLKPCQMCIRVASFLSCCSQTPHHMINHIYYSILCCYYG